LNGVTHLVVTKWLLPYTLCAWLSAVLGSMAATSFFAWVLLDLLGEFRKVLSQGCREVLFGHLQSPAQKPDYLYRTVSQQLLEWEKFP